MPTWLVDKPVSLYLLLGVIALLLAAAWWRTRDRKYIFGLLLVAVMAAIVVLLGLLIQTDHKRIQGKIEEMAGAVKAKDSNRILAHISEEFSMQGRSKEAFRIYADRAIQRGEVTEVLVWDFEPAKVIRPKDGGKATATIMFKAKPKSPRDNTQYYLVEAEFVKDPDGEWRMKNFEFFNPFVESKQPIQLPALP